MRFLSQLLPNRSQITTIGNNLAYKITSTTHYYIKK